MTTKNLLLSGAGKVPQAWMNKAIRATRFSWDEDYDGPIYDPHANAYHKDLESLEKHYQEICEEDEDFVPPNWVFASRHNQPALDYLNVLQLFADQYEIDIDAAGGLEKAFNGVDALKGFCELWSSAQRPVADILWDRIVMLENFFDDDIDDPWTDEDGYEDE